ncbi:hypothetical protein FOCC_FOCC003417 [Frankliniella occidentalis]|nr:hypothetical protein FOCC_FOCC003417 [Frankliniella occidentalis]
MDSGDEQKPKKRSRHSKSPSITRKESVSDNTNELSKEVSKEGLLEVKKEIEVNGHADDEVSSSTPAPSRSPPPLLTPKKEVVEESSVFENVKPSEGVDDKTDTQVRGEEQRTLHSTSSIRLKISIYPTNQITPNLKTISCLHCTSILEATV